MQRPKRLLVAGIVSALAGIVAAILVIVLVSAMTLYRILLVVFTVLAVNVVFWSVASILSTARETIEHRRP